MTLEFIFDFVSIEFLKRNKSVHQFNIWGLFNKALLTVTVFLLCIRKALLVSSSPCTRRRYK